ncbi:hypothetical protein HPB48_017320 [Haemaphysalis longicornis]|uniref:Uncharacterized protein n=1 Tax=Haemaphysalis longicornis TaxID=44386 RepID=A0A9J6GYR7_HAELO|nr:hypothetical protein HPB48_017320 [Haemaphysalis longicornis]
MFGPFSRKWRTCEQLWAVSCRSFVGFVCGQRYNAGLRNQAMGLCLSCFKGSVADSASPVDVVRPFLFSLWELVNGVAGQRRGDARSVYDRMLCSPVPGGDTKIKYCSMVATQAAKRQQMAEAAERRIQQQESRGIKDPLKFKRLQQKRDELDRDLEAAGTQDGNLRVNTLS